MRIYALFDAAGALRDGFWDDQTFPDGPGGARNPAIPAAAVAVTAEDRIKLVSAPQGWRRVGPDLLPYSVPVDLVAYARAARDRHEGGGITVRGVPVATDDRSKTLVQGARRRVELDPSLVTSWAAADGHIYPLDAAAIIAVSDAMGQHVAETFEGYARVRAGLANGTITSTTGVDAIYGALDVAF